MGITADIEADYFASLAALAWQVDLGADEAICEAPQNAYDLPEKTPWQTRPAAPAPAIAAAKTAATFAAKAPPVDDSAALAATCALAASAADACTDLAMLDSAAAAFDGCDLRKGARAAVGGFGPARTDLLVICDPPSAEAERAKQVLMLPEMSLFDQIFAAIGMGLQGDTPQSALHLAPALPWALRGDVRARDAALAIMRPFALRRIALVAPKVVVVMGHEALLMLLQGQDMARARGAWQAIGGADAPLWVMQSPQIIAKSGAAKRAAWADALAIKAALRAP